MLWIIIFHGKVQIQRYISLKIGMQSLPKTGVAPRRELSLDCNTLQLTNGKTTSLMGLADNEISTNSYLSSNVLLRLLFKLLNPCPLSLIGTILTAAMLPHSQAYPLWMFLAEFALVLLLIVVKEVYFDMMRRRADEKINRSKLLMKDSKVYRDGQEITELTWGDIREGDVLYLEKGEKAPADLLVLDTQYIEDRQAVVYVDARSITGRVTVQRKKACYLTQVTSRSAIKRNWDKYKKQYLTGKLKYELPNASMQDFLGYLKLVKDPKTSQITFENFISRESIIKTCWIYALVLHAGMNCKIMRHIGERNRNHKFFENYIDRIFVVCFAINILLGLPCALVGLAREGLNSTSAIAYNFMLFSIILPHFLYLGNGLLLLYFSFKNSLEAEIINYASIINLGSIDYAVIAYNGVLSSGKMSADEIITSSSLYDFRQEVSESAPRGSRRNGSLTGGNRQINDPNKTLKNKRTNRFFQSICNANSPAGLDRQSLGAPQIDTYFLDDDYKQDSNVRMMTGMQHIPNPSKFRMQLEPLKISRDKLSANVGNEEEEAMELMKAFGLCHQAILKSVDSQDIRFEANSRVYSEEVLLRLVNGIGIHVSSQIDARTKKQVGLRLKLQEHPREWFFSRKINTFQIERRIFSVVVREEGSQQRVLYCKGSPEDMLEKLRDKELRKNTLENKLAGFRSSKAEIIIFAKRTLSPAEYEVYDSEFTKLKMSSTVTIKDIQDFSSKFEKDLEFLSMVGLSSQKSETAKETTDYLVEKGIKMCVFTNNLAEIQSLKSLLYNQRRKHAEYVELQGRTVEEIRYNLNSVTRKLTSEGQYIYSLVIGPECWCQLKAHSSLMQHFLFALYYSDNVLTHGFTPQQKAELTQKIKNGFSRSQTLMSIGSSYSDLLFENYSDVSLIISSCDGQRIHSDIPSDIRAPTIASLRRIIDLGSWVTKAYNYLIHTSVYRTTLLGTIALVLQGIVWAKGGNSFNLDGTLVGLYVVLYGAIETIFTIKQQQRKGAESCHGNQVREKQYQIKFWTNIIEGLIHGGTIATIVMITLPNARLDGGKLFPVEAIHFSVYFLILNASIFRHLMGGDCSRLAVGVLALVSYPILLGALWIVPFVDPRFSRLTIQMGMIWTCYDSVLMICNATIFSLACSLFIAETRQKGMMGVLTQYYLNQKGISNIKRAKQLLGRDIGHIELVKHLFREEENIEESIQELVGGQFDTNQLKISPLLQIKKTEHRIKNEFNNAPLNLTRFKLTLIAVAGLFLAEVIHAVLARHVSSLHLIPLYCALIFLAVVLFWCMREGEDLGRRYYLGAEATLSAICIGLAIYEAVGTQSHEHFLLTCLAFIIVTQLLGVRLGVVLVLSLGCLITGIVLTALEKDFGPRQPMQILLICSCAVVNIVVLYGSTLDSRKNYILRQQIQMQTNQTNDIWTILVPEFVRNFFSQTGEDNSQYRENSVAILFCYVCNFDSIIEEEGRNVVRILDDLYREFDKLCSSFAVQKIETVGYTYMAATGIRKIESQMENQMVRRNKVERLVSMGQQMLDKTKLFKWGIKKNKDLDIKIGIHVGEVVVGVIGKHKKQFSLIGTNVNTTSRHGSTGNYRSITLSREARSELHSFPDEAFDRKDVYMKGLCKNKDETIPVFSLKNEEAGRRPKQSSGMRLRFRELVMKVIRSHRLGDSGSSDDEQMLANFVNINEPALQRPIPQSTREIRRRTTCRGLENNFNKIEEMKNRQDEIKCYSRLLEFDPTRAHQHFEETYPGKSEEDIQIHINKEQQLEEEYCEYLEKNRGVRDRLFVGVLFCLNAAFLAMSVILENAGAAEVGLRVSGLMLLGLLFWLTGHSHSYHFVNWICVAVFTFQLAVQKAAEMHTLSPASRIFSHFYVMMLVTVFSGINGMRFLHSVVMGVLVGILGGVASGVEGILEANALYEWFYVGLVLIRKYAFQKESIINFRQGRKTAQISNELSKIVSELLPKHAYQKLKTQNFENRLELTDLFEQCTILFADIKGFTEFSDRPENRKQPENVVRMLKSLFEEFDVLCTDLNVYKVYTIGDCYVVLGFTNCYDRNPIRQAQNVVNFAFEMLKTIDRVKKQKPALECLNMRIGIHTGTIIGGIVGTEIVRYDIYGSDVVVANKFEQTGKTGEIHISEETKKLLDQLNKKPYSENNIYASEKVEIKRLNVSYNGYFIKRGNLS